jgi:hypothetical protein
MMSSIADSRSGMPAAFLPANRDIHKQQQEIIHAT